MIPQPYYPEAITEAIGDLEPVKAGGCGHYFMRCKSHGHEGLYKGTSLRRAKKQGRPMRCRECVRLKLIPRVPVCPACEGEKK